MNDEAHMFGQGMSFPPRVGEDGRVAWSTGSQNIRESIRVILLTEPGERVMLAEFGGGLKRLLFLPNIVSTHHLIADAITKALGRWEPRVRVSDVSVEVATDNEQHAIATIRYTLVSNNAEDQLRLRLQLPAGG